MWLCERVEWCPCGRENVYVSICVTTDFVPCCVTTDFVLITCIKSFSSYFFLESGPSSAYNFWLQVVGMTVHAHWCYPLMGTYTRNIRTDNMQKNCINFLTQLVSEIFFRSITIIFSYLFFWWFYFIVRSIFYVQRPVWKRWKLFSKSFAAQSAGRCQVRRKGKKKRREKFEGETYFRQNPMTVCSFLSHYFSLSLRLFFTHKHTHLYTLSHTHTLTHTLSHTLKHTLSISLPLSLSHTLFLSAGKV